MLQVAYRWLALVALAAAITAVVGFKCLLAGEEIQGNRDKAANAQAQAAQFKVYQHDVDLSAALSSKLHVSDAKAADLGGKLDWEISHANDLSAQLAGARARIELTHHAVCLWERAWAAANLSPGETGPGSVVSPACVPGDDSQPSGFDLVDLLYSDRQQAGVCGDIRRQVISLQAFEDGAGGNSP